MTQPTAKHRRPPAPFAPAAALPDRRHPDPRDHGARAAVAPAARIPGVGAGRDDDVRGAPGDPPGAPRRRRPPARGRRSLLDPRSRRGDRLRAAARGAAARARRRPHRRHARLLREAAHDRRLEGPDQRPLARRQLRHQRRPAARAAHPAGDQRARPAGRHRVPRHDHAAVPRRPDRVGRDRRAHDREPGPPRARLGPVLPGRIQERHRRRRPHRRRRDQGRLGAAPLPVGDQGRPLGDRAHRRQRGLPHHPARRQGAQLRRRQRRGDVPRARRRPGSPRG